MRKSIPLVESIHIDETNHQKKIRTENEKLKQMYFFFGFEIFIEYFFI